MALATDRSPGVTEPPATNFADTAYLLKMTLAFVVVLLAVVIFLVVKVINLEHQASDLSGQVSDLSASTATGAPDPRIDDLCRFIGIWAAKSKVTLTTMFPSTAITGCETQADDAYHSVIAGQ